MARATLILRGVGIVSVILLFALLTQRLDKHGEEQRWNTPAFQQIQQKGWNSVHKTIRNHHETSAPQCSVQKSAMPWIRENREIYMVFYGKPIMQVLAEIGTSRGWKIRHIQGDSLEGQNEFKNLISPERLLFVVATSQAYRLDFVMALAKSTNALIGAIGNASKVTGTKQTQIISFRNHFQSFGCSLEATGIMPRSFVIDNPKECKNFFHYGRKRPQSLWVLKPVSGQGGNGITIHSNLTFFYKEYAKCSKRHKYIIQEYISNPLLLNKRKFDIRAYMLIAKTSPHYLVFYHKGQLRLSSKEFDIHGNRDVHLTNTNVQIHLEDYISEDHFWRFQDLQEYLNEHRPEDGKDFVSKTLVPFIQRIGTLIAHTAKPVFSRTPSNFLMLGLDIMVTSELTVKFIEANNYPLWPKGVDFIDKRNPPMANDMIDLLIGCRQNPERFKDMYPGEVYGMWTLIWNECINSTLYNPCKEFLP